jgi:hypothetical protein
MLKPKKDEVRGKRRRLHNEELCGPYSAPNIIRTIKSRKIRCVGHVECNGERRVLYRVLVEKPEVKRQFRRSKRKWEDIKVNLLEVKWGHRLN